jgi:hypothetical protein
MKFKYLVPYTFVVVVITILITVIAALLISRPNQQVKEVTNDVVIERIEEQFFAVTKTVYSDQDTNITIERNNDIEEFLWGKEVLAEGRVRVDLGVDLRDVQTEQINLNREDEVIEIETLGPEVLDASITGDIEVETEGTIITELFDNTNNEDYQEAITQLQNAAIRSVQDNEELLLKSEESAEQYLNYLFQDTGYEVRFVRPE